MLRSAGLATVLALAVGVAAGAAIRAGGGADVISAAETLASVGALWLNALRMTVIPLLFSLLVTGVASVVDAAATGRLAGRALLIFAVLLISATLYAVLILPVAYTIWPVDPGTAAAFIAGAGASPVEAPVPPTVREWLVGLAPSNPVAAAAEGAVLPLVFFALFFGFAATRLPITQREPMVGFFRAVADTMIVIVRWLLIVAPIGVFGLALGLGLRSGLGAAGVLLQYVAITSAVTLGVAFLAFLFAVFWARAHPAHFLAGTAPVLAVAFSTQSSLACLPLMVERARDVLGVPERVANLVLPLAVAVFRMTSPVTNLCVVFFVAEVYGIDLSIAQIASGMLVAFMVSVGSVGLPGQITFMTSVAPISIAMGVPIDVLGILLAVEVIPDIFRTVGNVTGDLAATVIARRSRAVLE